MIELGINIDHVATVRQARRTYEPDPVAAATEAELGGADSITVHLREDCRHIQNRDVTLLRQSVTTKLNLEMSLSEEITRFALDIKPDQATLVPENRQEITTEGGLDLLVHANRSGEIVRRLKSIGVFTSAFIDPDPVQVRMAKELGFDAIEIHTGSYALAQGRRVAAELARITEAGCVATEIGLRLHAGHGLNYTNTPPIARIPAMAELNIGHAIVSRAIFVGLRTAVREMRQLMSDSIPIS